MDTQTVVSAFQRMETSHETTYEAEREFGRGVGRAARTCPDYLPDVGRARAKGLGLASVGLGQGRLLVVWAVMMLSALSGWVVGYAMGPWFWVRF